MLNMFTYWIYVLMIRHGRAASRSFESGKEREIKHTYCFEILFTQPRYVTVKGQWINPNLFGSTFIPEASWKIISHINALELRSLDRYTIKCAMCVCVLFNPFNRITNNITHEISAESLLSMGGGAILIFSKSSKFLVKSKDIASIKLFWNGYSYSCGRYGIGSSSNSSSGCSDGNDGSNNCIRPCEP